MAYANTPGLTELQALLQSTQVTISSVPRVTSTLVTQFLQNPNSETDWNNMNTAIQSFMTTYSPLLAGLRVLVTLSDGHVAYDTSKGVNNTYANFQANTIGENHNTRIAIMVALLGSNGIGNEIKASTTTGTKQAYNAVRMGLSTSLALGCVRVSANST
jgi:hypothetical protein